LVTRVTTTGCSCLVRGKSPHFMTVFARFSCIYPCCGVFRKCTCNRIDKTNQNRVYFLFSMATPLVAGCVALLREALQDLHANMCPSATLIKALLVNGAINFSGKLGPGFGYDYEQGFGRVIIDSSIAMIRNGTFVDGRGRGGSGTGTAACGEGENDAGGRGSTRFDIPGLIQTGTDAQRRWESSEIVVPPGLGRSRLVATLAYPDPSGTQLHNVMNLIVVSGGASRHGNMGRNGGDAFDNLSKPPLFPSNTPKHL